MDKNNRGMTGYPLLLDLRDREVLVVGGGAVAARRVAALADAGARVVVVAPDSKPGVVPPLGWALSEMSRKRFTAAIDAATACNVDGEPSRTGYAGLRSLDGLMDFLGCPSADR